MEKDVKLVEKYVHKLIDILKILDRGITVMTYKALIRFAYFF